MSHPRRLSVISNGPTESVTPKVTLPHVPSDEEKKSNTVSNYGVPLDAIKMQNTHTVFPITMKKL